MRSDTRCCNREYAKRVRVACAKVRWGKPSAEVFSWRSGLLLQPTRRRAIQMQKVQVLRIGRGFRCVVLCCVLPTRMLLLLLLLF